MKLKRRKGNKKDTSSLVEEIRQETMSHIFKKPAVSSKNALSSGCSLLNLALSDNIDCGYKMGTVTHVIGDTHAGKSLLMLQMMAEAAANKSFDKYKFVYEEPESAMFFNISDMFGKEVAKRIKFIPEKNKKRKEPRTVQEWHDYIIKCECPFIHVTDSFDALTSEDDIKQISPTKGGWHTEKAGVASQFFPKVVRKIESTESLFFWVSQTRDNIGVTFGSNKTFTGGNAIKFYRSYEIWLAVVKKITKKVRGKDREIGAIIRAKIKKNKFTGKIKTIDFPVYPYPYGFGIDDVGSMVNWLVDENFWALKQKNGGKKTSIIETEEPFIDGKFEVVIKHIEENNYENKLKEIVSECWNDLEGELRTTRKRRYK